MQNTTVSFSFGENWYAFVKHCLTPERVAIAKEHLARFLDKEQLKGYSFLDIGCGSGLSSLAACELGAEHIVSFDNDPFSVAATQYLWESAGKPSHWTVTEGSILNADFLAHIEKMDIVYSWGVLHHTGQMWQAIENAANLMNERGQLYISLYVTTPKSAYWTRIKQRYNYASPLGKRLIEFWFLMSKWFRQLRDGRNPLREMREYQQRRGMAYMTDIRDWLGGYPYEHATIEEVLRFARKELSLELVNLATSEAAIEYLFVKQSPRNT
ncbi:probable 3-demethylubiquinone-9 3-methyltransferase [Candidatus Moduliflexus flocculans]|uniref:Probable 3-demethylubiquinone-9 3-methyltransferase n=1 Tax=Candidatus Moduliflexus flocculans TaxID=1499966 RepID=A0A081BNF2_9BACT|nr:probable 3-demethylubiquinone-9 3-methyltransferase [Candidatus Moduliflexus flocculans]